LAVSRTETNNNNRKIETIDHVQGNRACMV